MQQEAAAQQTFVSDEALSLAPLSTSTIWLLSQRAGATYGVDPVALYRTIGGESSYRASAVGDMKLICPRGVNGGLPVRARGLAQITQCYHPEVSDAQAFNPRFAIAWLAKQIALGHGCRESSVYRKWYCTVYV